MNPLFNTQAKYSVKPEAQRVEVEAFFCGVGGIYDTTVAQLKLLKAGYGPVETTTIAGIQFEAGEPYTLAGEAQIGFVYYFLPENVEKNLKEIYTALLSTGEIDDVNGDDALNDFDQYGKVQLRSRVDGAEWSKWERTELYA